VALLCVTGAVETERIKKAAFVGEVSLSGEIRRINGVLPMAILAQQGLTLECEIDDKPFEMQLDYERMARVLQNLFANAAKYAEQGTAVKLSTAVTGSEMQICLSNTVAGGAQVDTASMFDRFYKQDRSRTDTSGAGLGLAIAKRITELHGGSISAQQTGASITVTVTLRK
jgi:signal transduction histidine kinase